MILLQYNFGMESFLFLISFTALSLLTSGEAHGVNKVQANLPGPSRKDISSQQTSLLSDGGRSKRHAVFSSCAEVQLAGHRTNGVYTLQVFSKEIEVYCDLTTDGGGWAVFQRRDDYTPPLDFYRNWMAYKTGFGDINKDFWLGLDNMHRLSSHAPCSLRIELEDFEGNKRFANYDRFHISGESNNNYKLLVEGFSGNAGDSFGGQNGYPFSTFDRDNDIYSANCAVEFHGAWWYTNCHGSNLNGKYLRGNHTSYADGVEWSSWHGQHYSLKKTEMKIRPVDFLSFISQ